MYNYNLCDNVTKHPVHIHKYCNILNRSSLKNNFSDNAMNV